MLLHPLTPRRTLTLDRCMPSRLKVGAVMSVTLQRRMRVTLVRPTPHLHQPANFLAPILLKAS